MLVAGHFVIFREMSLSTLFLDILINDVLTLQDGLSSKACFYHIFVEWSGWYKLNTYFCKAPHLSRRGSWRSSLLPQIPMRVLFRMTNIGPWLHTSCVILSLVNLSLSRSWSLRPWSGYLDFLDLATLLNLVKVQARITYPDPAGPGDHFGCKLQYTLIFFMRWRFHGHLWNSLFDKFLI